MNVFKKHKLKFSFFFVFIIIIIGLKIYFDKPINDCENKENIEIKTFQISEGWGFDILVNNKKCIHQTNIPAINGNKPFKTEKDAKKIAGLMKFKICKNIFPPSVTIQEIDSLITK
jgi:hypothetical protein